LLPVARRLHRSPLSTPSVRAERGLRPEPAAPELLDDDPSPVALHGLRDGERPLRLLYGGTRHRRARRCMDPLYAALDALRLVLLDARQLVRRRLGVRGARLGRLLGVGSG